MPNVVVIGDPMVDRYIYGDVSRVNPEAPSLLLDVNDTVEQAGGAANVAKIISRLHCSTSFIGPVNSHLRYLAPTVMFIDGEIDKMLLKTRYMNGDVTLLRVDTGKSFSPQDSNLVLQSVKSMNAQKCNILDIADVVIVSDYAKGIVTRELIDEIATRLPETAKIVIDTKKANFQDYDGFLSRDFDVYITVNFAEWTALDNKQDIPVAIVSMGADGLAVFELGNETERLKTTAGPVRSVVGAGDVVTAVFAYALTFQDDFKWAARIAEAAATKAVALPRTSNDV